MSENLTEQTPAQIDGQIADINQRADRPSRRLSAARDIFARRARQDENTVSWERISEYQLERAAEMMREAEEELAELEEEARPLHAEYERRGSWPRYYHVTNSNGHVHTSIYCPSCFYDTQYAWRTDLSGLTEEEVVEREAHWACSVCMPIAPADQKAAFKAYQERKRTEKAQEREAKKAEKAARKLAREESLAHKANAALDKYGDDYIKQAWYDGKITDSVYDTLYDAGRAGNEGKY